MDAMTLKAVLKRTLPPAIVSALKAVRAMGKRKAIPVFTLTAEARAEAVARFARIDWRADAPSRILYGLVPTAGLRNVGDHAQVVAIQKWITKHYPGRPIVELDKNVVVACADQIRAMTRPTDLVFLHSGGNLGDRGLWSETARRTLISALPNNRIVSLPQTIFFSDTPAGHHQKAASKAIYATHDHLTVMGRDQVSGELAKALFPRAQVITMPDFVLSLRREDFGLPTSDAHSGKVLACLRLDDESIFSAAEREQVVARIGAPTTLYDTTLSTEIEETERNQIVRDALALFNDHEAIVTDRFHGVIFGVLCRKPVVVLRTVDHKLTSAVAWFKDIPNVQFCDHLDQLHDVLERVRATPVKRYPDFNALYFDRLPGLIEQMPRRYRLSLQSITSLNASR